MKWIRCGAAPLPPIGTRVEILHFGDGMPEHQIVATGVVEEWGIYPLPAEKGGHAKSSTISHWRELPATLEGEKTHG